MSADLANARQRGLTLVEVMVSLVIVSLVMTCIIHFFIQGRKHFESGTHRLDAAAYLRDGLQKLKADVRGSSVSVKTEGDRVLKIWPIRTDARGLVRYDAGGLPQTGEVIEYRYDDQRRTLTRNGRTVADNIEFFRVEVIKLPAEAGAEAVDIPCVKVIAVFKAGQRFIKVPALAVPRYMARLARDPSWVKNTLGQTLKINVE